MSLREDYLILKQDLIDIADAIREKKGIKKKMKLDEMGKILEKDDAILVINSLLEEDSTTDDYALHQIAQEKNMIFEYSYSFSSTPQAKTLKYNAFKESPLINLDLATISEIKGRACYNCKNLSSINAPNVIKINEYAFCGCTSLKKIVLPKIEFIDSYVFDDSGIEEIYLPGDNFCTLNRKMDIMINPVIYVPEKLITQYKEDPNWKRHTILSNGGVE